MPELRPSKSPLSRGQRHLILAAIAAALVGYAAWGVIRDDLVIPVPGPTTRGNFHFHGASALAVAATFACAALAMVVRIVEDRRAPAGGKADHTWSNLLAGVGFAVFLVLETLKQFRAI